MALVHRVQLDHGNNSFDRFYLNLCCLALICWQVKYRLLSCTNQWEVLQDNLPMVLSTGLIKWIDTRKEILERYLKVVIILMRQSQFLERKPKNAFSINFLVNVGFMLVLLTLMSMPFFFTTKKISVLDQALTLMIKRTRAVFDFFECAHRLLHRTL